MELHLHLLHRILVLLIIIGHALLQSPCEDWEAYKDENCIKIFNIPGVLGYDDAEAYCSAQSANLMSIRTRDKQEFLEQFLKSNSVTDNVWLGLKYFKDNGYEWLDGTPFRFANWATGSPKYDSSYCVEMHTEEEQYGKWSEVECSRRNLILCEKLQLWPYSKLQKVLMNVVMNPIPMGFIYAQLPKEKLPTEIWPLLGWEDVTKEYAGVFFRAEGGNSSSFGQIQEENAPRLVHLQYDYINQDHVYAGKLDLYADNKQSPTMLTGTYLMGNHNSQSGLKFTTSSGERSGYMPDTVWKIVLHFLPSGLSTIPNFSSVTIPNFFLLN